MKYEIVWTGKTLPSLKNSKQFRINRKTGARFITSSDEHKEWEQVFIKDIKSLHYTLGKVSSAVYTFQAPNKRKFDLENKCSSINDALVKAGFLEDDNYECIPEITLKWGGVNKGEWKVILIFNT